MRYLNQIALVFIVLALPSPSAAIDTYLKWVCAAEASGGVRYSDLKQGWEGGQFQAKSSYVLSFSERSQQWNFLRIGDEHPIAVCPLSKNNPKAKTLDCGLSSYSLIFSLDTQRYLLIHHDGGLTTERGVTPFVEVGACSKF